MTFSFSDQDVFHFFMLNHVFVLPLFLCLVIVVWDFFNFLFRFWVSRFWLVAWGFVAAVLFRNTLQQNIFLFVRFNCSRTVHTRLLGHSFIHSNTVGIQLLALQLPETSSYWTFTSPLTERSVKVTWQGGPFSWSDFLPVTEWWPE